MKICEKYEVKKCYPQVPRSNWYNLIHLKKKRLMHSYFFLYYIFTFHCRIFLENFFFLFCKTDSLFFLKFLKTQETGNFLNIFTVFGIKFSVSVIFQQEQVKFLPFNTNFLSFFIDTDILQQNFIQISTDFLFFNYLTRRQVKENYSIVP